MEFSHKSRCSSAIIEEIRREAMASSGWLTYGGAPGLNPLQRRILTNRAGIAIDLDCNGRGKFAEVDYRSRSRIPTSRDLAQKLQITLLNLKPTYR